MRRHGGPDECYKVWPPEKPAAGKGDGKGKGKDGKPPKILEKDKDGNVKPIGQVGCSFLALGMPCPGGGVLDGDGGTCKFSHTTADVNTRKKFLAENPSMKPKKPGKGKGGGRGDKAAEPGGTASDSEEVGDFDDYGEDDDSEDLGSESAHE